MKAKKPGGLGAFFHRFIEAVRRLIEAVRHVKSGGQSTRSAAVRRVQRARSAPRKCTECGQDIAASPDWEDHLNDDEPDCQSHGWS